MSIPAQVQAAANKADDFLKQIAGEGGQSVDGQNIDGTKVNQQTTGDGSAGEHGVGGTIAGDQTRTTEHTERRVDDAISQIENESLSRLNRSLDNENRHMKIKCAEYDREITKLKKQIEELESGVQNNANLSDGEIGLTDEERAVLEEEGLSEEAVKILMKRTVAKNPKLGELEQKVDTIARSTQEIARKRFFAEVKTAVPDWEAINSDAGFLEMMNEAVPYQSYTFQELMDHANSKNDSSTVARIFMDYKAKGKAPQQSGSAQGNSRKTLDNLVEPTQSRSVVHPKGQSGDYWDAEQIKKFYDDVRRYPRKYTPEQITGIEAKHIFRV